MTTGELLTKLAALDIRLWLEDDRLRVNAPKGVLTPELRDEMSAHKGEIIRALHSASHARPLLLPVSRDGVLAASFAQTRLWFIQQLDPESAAYNIPVAVRVQGALDRRALEHAWQYLAGRHEALRTALAAIDGRPVQVIREVRLPVIVRDLSSVPEGGRMAACLELLQVEAARPFALDVAPLARITVVDLGHDDHVMMAVLHHAIADQVSLAILMRELEVCYRAALDGTAPDLPALPIQYADYAAWQAKWLDSPAWERELAYWKQRLDGLAQLQLPTDRPRPAVLSARGRTIASPVPASLVDAVQRASHRAGVTTTTLLLTAFALLLRRWCAQTDVGFAIPVSNRDDAALDSVVGALINTLVIRVDAGGNPSLAELTHTVGTVLVEAQEHRDAPWERLIAELQPTRSTSHASLVQVMFNALNTPAAAPGSRLFGATPIVVDRGGSQMDLSLTTDLGQGWLFAEFSDDLFDEATVRRLLEYFLLTLDLVATAPDRRVDDIDLLIEQDRRRLAEWNATAVPFDPEVGVEDMFAAHAAKAPAAPAVVSPAGTLSYGELDDRSSRLAAFLVGAGVGPDSLVGVCLQRTPALLVAVLGVLKAGAAYVPLDPAFPAQRIAYMVEDAQLGLILTDAASIQALPDSGARHVQLDSDWAQIAAMPPRVRPAGCTADHLAYVLYTSGSTGRPKGVAVPRRALSNFIRAMQDAPGLGANGAVLAVTTLSFDIAGLELYLPLSVGARIVLATREQTLDGPQLRHVLETTGTTMLQATPATWRLLLDAGWAGTAGLTMLCGGEAMPPDLAAQLLSRGHELWNMYGPTETTIWSTIDRVSAADTITIGRPIPNTQIQIVDERLHRVPIGVPGELCIGGDGVARGYLGRPELTAERFVADPASPAPGARLYRTGDLARWLPDGRIEHLGRSDDQVKLRGFRIELGEIESVLARHPSVAAAVVAVHADTVGERRLVGYVVPRAGHDLPLDDLRRLLRAALPEYMVPSLFVELAALPLTANGKIDRRALPAPDRSSRAGQDRVAPRTPVESRIADIWSGVLRSDELSVHDDFFRLGGHSLLAAQVIARVRDAFGVDLAVRTIFEASTIAELATVVEGLSTPAWSGDGKPVTSDVPRSAEASLRPVAAHSFADGSGPLSYAQRRLWFFEQMEPGTSVFNIPLALRLEGQLDVARLRRAVEGLAARHETLRTSVADRDGEPVQVVHESIALPFAYHDLRAMPPREREHVLAGLRKAVSEAFELERAPLWRIAVICTGDGENLLLWTFHHLISDGWSLRVALRELIALYEHDGEAPLPPLPVHYRDYSTWQTVDVGEPGFERQLDFWRAYLHGPLPVLELPTDAPRTAGQSFTGGISSATVSPELTRRLEHLARTYGATSFMVLCALFQALLSRLSGQSDIIVGVPVAGRTDAALESLIGVFINTLPLRSDVRPDQPFAELLKDVRHSSLEAFARQDVPFERIVQAVRPERDPARTPIFQALFNMFDADPDPVTNMDGVALTMDGASQDWSSKFDLTMYATVLGAAIRFDLVYNAQLFAAERAAEMLRQYVAILEQVVVVPGTPVGQLSLVTTDARAVLPDPRTPLAPGWEGSVSARVRGWAASDGSRIAVADPDTALRYAELDTRADHLARSLRALGVGHGDRVAVAAARRAALVPTLLGIWRAGAAFVIVDPAYPAQRVLDCLAVARPAGIIAISEESATTLPTRDWCREHGAWWELADVLQRESPRGTGQASEVRPEDDDRPDRLAYLAFTSGTTGRPKAVAGTHAPLSHFFEWQVREFALSGQDRVSVLSGLAHDPLLRDVFTPLWAGGTAVIPDSERMLEPGYLADWLRAERITAAHITPALASVVLAGGAPDSSLPALRALFCGGDRLRYPLAAALGRVAPSARLVNFYGATETPQAIAWNDLDIGIAGREGEIPIGRGIPGVQLLVLNDHGALAGIGELGEIHVRTPYLSIGYFEDERLTSERFRPSPEASTDDDRMYRTGDWGRYLPDGRVQVVGRRDLQVKVRGYRIELSEIDQALCRHPGVASAVTVSAETASGDAQLIAYVVPRAGVVAEQELRAHLRQYLPGYMLPSVLQSIAALPLTANGKIDRRALPAPGRQPAVGRPTVDVEPIEAAMAQHPAVDRAVASVELDQAGEPRLLIYVTYRTGEDATASELRRHVRSELAAVPFPAMFVPVEQFTMTAAGVVDRSALPSPFGHVRRTDPVAPRTPTERLIASIWIDLLRIDEVSVQDNFFDVGGHSLLSVQAVRQIEKHLGVRLNPRLLVVDNLEQLAVRCDRAAAPEEAAGGAVAAGS